MESELSKNWKLYNVVMLGFAFMLTFTGKGPKLKIYFTYIYELIILSSITAFGTTSMIGKIIIDSLKIETFETVIIRARHGNFKFFRF